MKREIPRNTTVCLRACAISIIRTYNTMLHGRAVTWWKHREYFSCTFFLIYFTLCLSFSQHGDQCECPSGTFGDHCECPEGWHGLYCQHKVEDCDGEGEHFCLHGSKCVKDSVTNQHACDCTEADQHSIGGFLFVGFSCEQATNTVCTKLEGDPIPGKPLSFCDNGGTCKKMVSQDEG